MQIKMITYKYFTIFCLSWAATFLNFSYPFKISQYSNCRSKLQKLKFFKKTHIFFCFEFSRLLSADFIYWTLNWNYWVAWFQKPARLISQHKQEMKTIFSVRACLLKNWADFTHFFRTQHQWSVLLSMGILHQCIQ